MVDELAGKVKERKKRIDMIRRGDERKLDVGSIRGAVTEVR